ncbi:MAG: hypothetical protein RL033_947 [Pseudomonadota bacterium]|jgi:hypothetical protein
MKRIKKSGVAVAMGLVGIMLVAGSSLAIEPTDNNSPTGPLLNMLNATFYECGISGNGCGFNTNDAITTSTDNDFYVVACGQSRINTITVTLVNAPFTGTGDIDLDVLKPNNTTIGTSHGVGQVETVNTSAANLNAVIVRVFGFNGGKNTYQVGVSCQ